MAQFVDSLQTVIINRLNFSSVVRRTVKIVDVQFCTVILHVLMQRFIKKKKKEKEK